MAPTARSRVTLLLLGLLLLRLALMAALPLNDTTEARYAEIARKMLESGDWVTLWHDYGVPFWAKPPLSTWLGAAAMGLLGENELAVRLPSLLLGLATLWLTAELARRRDGAAAGRASALILAGSLLFFVAAGAMMTDPALLLAVTLSLAAFWHALHGGGRLWGYAFFAGLGLGLLAKGPLAVVLVGLTVAPWVALRRQWRALWQCLPWPGGSLLALAIALPWYALAEWRTPGFLEYFIVGEHLGRFLDPGWSGDRYGFAHASPRGLIWLHAAGALLPWSLLAPLWWWRARRSAAPADADGWRLYLWLWTLAPLLFFSLSGNVIFPYALPALPGAALLLAALHRRAALADGRLVWPAALAALPWAALLAALLLAPAPYLRTQKALIAAWSADAPAPGSALLYWDSRREFSAEFYSRGRARTIRNPAILQQMLAGPPRDYLVLDVRDRRQLPATLLERLEPVVELPVAGERLLLLRERPAAPSVHTEQP